jgi:hypothetical protein
VQPLLRVELRDPPVEHNSSRQRESTGDEIVRPMIARAEPPSARPDMIVGVKQDAQPQSLIRKTVDKPPATANRPTTLPISEVQPVSVHRYLPLIQS